MDLNLAKDFYTFEWELREKLTNWLQAPITTLTLLPAALAYLIEHEPLVLSFRLAVFYGLITIAVAAWIYAVYSVIRSLWGYTYEKLPRLSALLKHHATLHAHFRTHPNTTTDADLEFRKYLVTRMAQATDTNAANNIKKSFWAHQAGGASALALVATGIAGLQFVLLH